MLISELLITVFVVQWLNAQRISGINSLKELLSQEFTKTEQQVIDTMLLKSVIHPMITKSDTTKEILIQETRDQKNGIVNKSHTDSASNYLGTRENWIKYGSIEHECNEAPVDDEDTFSTCKQTNEKLETSDSLSCNEFKEKILINGTELMFNEFCEIENLKNSFFDSLKSTLDTLLFKNIYSKEISKIGLIPFLRWVNAVDTTHEAQSKPFFVLKSSVFTKTMFIDLKGLNMYLFKKISSQFVFSLVLLFVTSLSFWFAYKNVKKQIRLNMIKSDLISNISHELKTPVSSVKLAIEVLKNFDFNRDEKKRKEYLEIAFLEINRLDFLIDKVMNTSFFENDKLILTRQKTNMKDLAVDLIDSLKVWFADKKAVVTLNAPNEMYEAYIDKFHIEGVFKNLIENSIKYGQEQPHVQVGLSQTNDEIIIFISDDGPGIPNDYADKVFDKFFRVPSGDKHNVKGYGLGLSYVSLVVQQHGGRIMFRNNASGKGCTVTFYIPKSIK